MSLWFQRKGAASGTHYYSVPFAPLAIVALIGMGVALVWPMIQAARAWLGG